MNKLKNLKTDVLVAGSGIAGVKSALVAAKNGCSVTLITKNKAAASNHVLGFNAPLLECDSEELYAKDTIKGGWDINNPELVEVLSQNSAKEVEFLENEGIAFDKDEEEYNLLKPLGCTVPRLAHIENLTGKISLEKFFDMAINEGVNIICDAMLSDVITKNGKAIGATVFDLKNKKEFKISAKAVVIATGGIHIATDSTYPFVMTGDGYGAAYRAGAELTDMEFIQYEPCRCIYPQKLGISTTLLAKGGKITNADGERFLLKHYDSEGSIPKDMLSKLIYAEILKGNALEHGGVYLDLTDIDEAEIKEKHVLYYNRFKNAGIDITKEKIEVAPCAHSFMGGIVIDKDCKTCIDGLYAAGEAAGGIHGANRVGGNAGTEIYVFGTVSGKSASDYAKNCDFEKIPDDNEMNFDDGQNFEYFENVKAKIRSVMSKYMGPVRNGDGLETALEIITNLDIELKNTKAESFDALVSKKEKHHCDCNDAFHPYYSGLYNLSNFKSGKMVIL